MKENPEFRKKKVALVSNSAWSVYNFRLDVILHLIAKYEVLVIAPSDEFTGELKKAGCHFIPILFNNRSENPLQDIGLYRQLKKIYLQEKPDFIFHYVIKPNIYGSLAAASCAIKSVAVVTGLGYSFDRQNWLYRIVSILYKRALRKTEEVWFLNNEDAGMFVHEKLVEIGKVKVLPGEGVNTAHFLPASHKPVARNKSFVFLMSTRLLRSKGIGLYVAAARMLKKKYSNLRFELIGFFEKQHPDSVTEQELKEWRKKDLISYHGFAKDVRPFLKQADCFVFPSFYNEGIPKCLMEAASMELPIITSLNRGCKEVVADNLNGYLCHVNDPFDLMDKMEKMMHLSSEERSVMGKEGRKLVTSKFDISRILSEYDRTLQDL